MAPRPGRSTVHAALYSFTCDRAGTAYVFDWGDLPMIYKQYLLRLIEDFPKSHGDNSTVARAAQYRQQKISLASPMTGPLQGMAREAQGKLLTWAGIPDIAAL